MISTYEELQKRVEERRNDVLTIEVDMGDSYSQPYEDAKKELKQAEALQMIAGGNGFLGDNLEELKAKVESLRPEPDSVFIKFKRLDLMSWAVLMKQTGMSPVDQYEKVLPKTFVGVYGSDDPDAEPLSTNPKLLSSQGDMGILPGGALHQVVQVFMTWQNTGGEVAIRPTKSGQD